MDPEVVENIREIGKSVEDCGRMLQTKRKRWFTRQEIRHLRMALKNHSDALKIYEEMIPKQ
jgi:hypothetical protein